MNNSKQISGVVFLIQSYSVQDGPGIRTTVFLKACSLRCRWCQNPESWNNYPELITRDAKCVLLGKCKEVCPADAIMIDSRTGRIIDRNKCDLCFKCVPACPSGALSKIGDHMTVDEVMSEIKKDEPFLVRSQGGVTVSGGEPLNQPVFACELLKGCKEIGLHTALDTSGQGDWTALEKILVYTDLVLYDIKHMDSERHKTATGVGNNLILSNLRKIPPEKKIWLRIPLIPGYNDSKENLKQVAYLAKEVKAEKISILPFHKLGEGKYAGLGRIYSVADIKPYDKSRINEIHTYLQGFEIQVSVGS